MMKWHGEWVDISGSYIDLTKVIGIGPLPEADRRMGHTGSLIYLSGSPPVPVTATVIAVAALLDARMDPAGYREQYGSDTPGL